MGTPGTAFLNIHTEPSGKERKQPYSPLHPKEQGVHTGVQRDRWRLGTPGRHVPSQRVKDPVLEQDSRSIRGHAHPLPQTQQKKHIYRINDSHRTATNRWQRNLNSNNGKKFVTLLGRTGEKRRVREGESERDGRSRKGTAEEKGIPHPGKSPTGGKIKRTGGISRCREECSSKLEYGKADQEPNGPSELRAQSPKIETPGWGLGTETSAPEISPRARGAGQSGNCLGGL